MSDTSIILIVGVVAVLLLVPGAMTEAQNMIQYLLNTIGDIPNPLPSPSPDAPIIVDSTIFLTESLDGGGKTYKHGPGLGDYPLFKLTGTGITLSNVIIDDADLGYSNGAVVISGTGNSIKFCTLKNCIRYGFTISSATNFYIGYNTVEKAQYGIAGSSGGGASGWGKNGVIEHNTIRGTINLGIKCKALDHVIIRNNNIDLTPTTAAPTKTGLEFSNDAPNLYVTVEYNQFIREGDGAYASTHSMGIRTETPPNVANPEIITTGNIIRGNTITGCRWGIYCLGDNFTFTGNTITGALYPTTNNGTNNVIN